MFCMIWIYEIQDPVSVYIVDFILQGYVRNEVISLISIQSKGGFITVRLLNLEEEDSYFTLGKLFLFMKKSLFFLRKKLVALVSNIV